MSKASTSESLIRLGMIAMLSLSWLSMAHADPEGDPVRPKDVSASASMAQLIDAARRQKAQELESAAQRLLGDTGAPPLALPAPAPTKSLERAKRDEFGSDTPQIWSLSGIGERIQAEVLYQGQIVHVDRASLTGARIGPWTVTGIATDHLALMRTPSAAAQRRAGRPPETLILYPSRRGEPLTRFALPSPAGPEANDAMPASAVRAGQLPLGWNAPDKGR